MNEFVKQSIITVVIIILILSAFAYLGMFIPLNTGLRNSIINNFSQLADSKFYSLDNSINKNIEGAESISSRTMIQNKIVEFHNEIISFDDLKEFTQPKYEDGAKVLDDLMIGLGILLVIKC